MAASTNNAKSDFDPYLDEPLWGAQSFADVLNTSVRKVYYMVSAGHLDASRIGDRLVSTRRRLLVGITDGSNEAA